MIRNTFIVGSAFLFIICFKTTALSQWTPASGVGGNVVFCFTTHNQYIFAGTDRGVLRSGDEGLTWSEVNTGLLCDTVYALAQSGQYLFAGTYIRGIFRSSDDGASWAAVNTGLTNNNFTTYEFTINAFAVMGKTIFVSTPYSECMVARSTDDGMSWTPIVNQQTINLTQGGGHCTFIQQDSSLIAVGDESACRSIDNGTTWVTMASFQHNRFNPGCMTTLGSNLIAWVHYVGIIQSTNSGKSWILIDSQFADGKYYFNTLTTNGSELFAGGVNGAYHSVDGGKNWVEVDSGINFKSIGSFLIHGINLFAATEGFQGNGGAGIFRSSNNALTWTSVNLAVSGGALFTSGNDLFAGNALSTDNGSHWIDHSYGPFSNLQQSAIGFAANDSKMFAVTGSNAYSTSDRGATWQQIQTPSHKSIENIAVDGSTIAIGGADPYGCFIVSTDNGATWGYPSNSFTQWSVRAVGVFGKIVFASQTNGGHAGIYRSADNGQTFKDVDYNGLDAYAFAKIGTHLFVATDYNVFRSTDQGVSWVRAYNGLPGTYRFTTSLCAAGALLFAGVNYSGGIYLSSDEGNSWVSITEGLKDSCINSLAANNKFLFASTCSGIWRRSLSDFGINSVKSAPETNLQLSLFPNPTNGLITLNDPANDITEISVFTMLGEKVIQHLKPGSSPFTFDLSKLPSGIYTVRIFSGNSVVSRMIVRQ